MSARSVSLGPDARVQLLDALKAGTPRPAAARYVGLEPEELELLLATTPALEREVLTAEATLEVSTAAGMAKAAKGGDWRAGQALLERRPASVPVGRCGARTRADTACRQPRGHKTDHPGTGNCWLHGGRTPNGKRHAQTEAAERELARLGVPRGTGDPFALLAKAVQHADGHLEAASQLVQDASGTPADGAILVDLTAAVDIYETAIRTAFRTAKAAVDADVADRLAALDERASELLMRFVAELLERAVPEAKRPAITVWARERLAELGAEYERPGTAAAVH